MAKQKPRLKQAWVTENDHLYIKIEAAKMGVSMLEFVELLCEAHRQGELDTPPRPERKSGAGK